MSKATADSVSGLTSDEARRRLKTLGPNDIPDTSVHLLRVALEKLWAPVPWMLEAAILLELALGKYVEAAIIAGLLVFNAALGLLRRAALKLPLRHLSRGSRCMDRSGATASGRRFLPRSWCLVIW
jgi:H+-transporting ATPase